MAVQTYEGIVEKGRIRLIGDVQLPDHARVYVVVPGIQVKPVRIASPHLVHPEQWKDFEKEVRDHT